MDVQSWCFSNLILLLFCHSRCRRHRRCLNSVLLSSYGYRCTINHASGKSILLVRCGCSPLRLFTSGYRVCGTSVTRFQTARKQQVRHLVLHQRAQVERTLGRLQRVLCHEGLCWCSTFCICTTSYSKYWMLLEKYSMNYMLTYD